MATDRIEELKSVQFPVERRGGYDRRAVDAYLAELADWLESGGADEARRSVIQAEMSRVGERTGTVLSAAQVSADELTVEARAEADRLRAEADRETKAIRADADAYATKTRADADEQARLAVEAATAEAKKVTADADARLQAAEAEAAARTAGIEQEIAVLVRKRRDVVANLEQLNAELRLSIEGPGEQELDLPSRVEAAVDDPEEAPTTVSEVVGVDELAEGEPDTDEREAEEQDERDRRRRSVDSVDPPTDDTKLTELL